MLINHYAWGLVPTEATMAGFRRVSYVPLTAAGWRVRAAAGLCWLASWGCTALAVGVMVPPWGRRSVRPAPCMACGRCRRILSAGPAWCVSRLS